MTAHKQIMFVQSLQCLIRNHESQIVYCMPLKTSSGNIFLQFNTCLYYWYLLSQGKTLPTQKPQTYYSYFTSSLVQYQNVIDNQRRENQYTVKVYYNTELYWPTKNTVSVAHKLLRDAYLYLVLPEADVLQKYYQCICL